MTKVDRADPSVAKDIRKVDQSETIQEKVRCDELRHLDADRWRFFRTKCESSSPSHRSSSWPLCWVCRLPASSQ